jgi:hypothetical protein
VMGFLDKFLGVEKIVETVGDVVDDFHLSKEEKLKLELDHELETRKIVSSENVAQIGLNTQEAKGSWFQSGWRPAIGWICAAGFAYQFIVFPLLTWLWVYLGAKGLIDLIDPPPELDTGALMFLASGMLGMAGYRTFERVKGVGKG